MERWRALGLDTSSHADLLVRRLSHLAELSPKELALIESLADSHEKDVKWRLVLNEPVEIDF